MAWGCAPSWIGTYRVRGAIGAMPPPSLSIGCASCSKRGVRSLEDLRALRREAGLMRLLDRAAFPDPDTLGDWLRRMGDP